MKTNDEFLQEAGYSTWKPDSVYAKDGVLSCYKLVSKTGKKCFLIQKWPQFPGQSEPSYVMKLHLVTKSKISALLEYYGLSITQLKEHLTQMEKNLKQGMDCLDF